MTQPTKTRNRKWVYNVCFGFAAIALSAFAPTAFLGRLAQVMLLSVGAFSLYQGGRLMQLTTGGPVLGVSEVGKWMHWWVMGVAAIEFAIALWSVDVGVRLALSFLGGIAEFSAGMMREKYASQAVPD